jgi:hypothetical protein
VRSAEEIRAILASEPKGLSPEQLIVAKYLEERVTLVKDRMTIPKAAGRPSSLVSSKVSYKQKLVTKALEPHRPSPVKTGLAVEVDSDGKSTGPLNWDQLPLEVRNSILNLVRGGDENQPAETVGSAIAEATERDDGSSVIPEAPPLPPKAVRTFEEKVIAQLRLALDIPAKPTAEALNELPAAERKAALNKAKIPKWALKCLREHQSSPQDGIDAAEELKSSSKEAKTVAKGKKLSPQQEWVKASKKFADKKVKLTSSPRTKAEKDYLSVYREAERRAGKQTARKFLPRLQPLRRESKERKEDLPVQDFNQVLAQLTQLLMMQFMSKLGQGSGKASTPNRGASAPRRRRRAEKP